MGPRQNPRRATVLQSDGVKRSPSWSAPNITEDSHGAFRRDRRVVGTQQRVCGRWPRQDRARGKGGERAGGPGPVLPRAGDWGDADRIGLEAGPLSQWLHAGLVAA